MSNRLDTKIILGSLRYKSAPDTNLLLNVPLIQQTKENVEFDRIIDVNLEQVFDDERQSSTIFRPTCKFSVIFKNSYTGQTQYTPLENNLYYVNEITAAAAECDPTQNSENVYWKGFPQYNEFDFIRNDYNVIGYTQPPNNHITFTPKSASTYNWGFYLSYPYDNITNKTLKCFFDGYGLPQPVSFQWNCSDGIPFIINKTTFNGRNIISFRSVVKHGLNVGEFFKIKISSQDNNQIYQVYSLGDEFNGSSEYIFNIIDVGYQASLFPNGERGTVERIINDNISGETTSRYYIRRHKILTNIDDAILTKAGFEINGFGVKKKFESSGFTPTRTSRVSIKEGAQSYTLSFNKDFNLNGMVDNQKRPITELFFTTIWRGYFGLTFGLRKNLTEYSGVKQGYEFNLPLVNNQPNNWWSNNGDSETNFPIGTYTTSEGSTGGINNGPIIFTYIKPLNEGDIIEGDLCEWNDYEQTERVVSKLYHKFTFNPFVFDISETDNNTNQLGYYYQPHFSLKIRDYSDYIEEGEKNNIVGIPDYSYFSPSKNKFIWRDLYSYGYIDPVGNGVNYPFLNGTHYPYDNYIFRIIPEGTNYIEQDTVAEPLIDDCE
jgi:hypothetical protein